MSVQSRAKLALSLGVGGVYPPEFPENGFPVSTGTRPVIVGSPTTAVQDSGTQITVPVPSGTQNGDLLFVVIRGQSNAAAADILNANFTRIGPAFVASSADGRVFGMFVKRVTASAEPASYVFTSASTSNRIVASMSIIRPTATGTGVDVASSSYAGTDITNGREAASLTATGPNGLAIFVGAAELTAGQAHVPVSTPSGFTQVVAAVSPSSGDTGVSRTYLWMGRKNVEAGATGAAQIVWGALVNGRAAQMVVFKQKP